jgi:hypothetical protein
MLKSFKRNGYKVALKKYFATGYLILSQRGRLFFIAIGFEKMFKGKKGLLLALTLFAKYFIVDCVNQIKTVRNPSCL